MPLVYSREKRFFMHFTDFIAFDHYQTSHSQEISIYTIFLDEPYEIKAIMDRIKSFYPDYEPFSFSANSENVSSILQEIRTPSLFASKKIFFIEEAHLLKKGAFSLKTVPPQTVLIFGSKSKKLHLEKSLTQKALSLDILKEKPWERDKRITFFINLLLQKENITLNPALLLEKIGPDLGLLKQQIDKLICFVGDRKSIEKEDIEKIVETSKVQTAWKMGEEIIWNLCYPFSSDLVVDAHLFYPLLSSLRHQLQLGLKLCLLMEKGEKDLSSHFPRVYPSTLNKRVADVRKLSKGYFEKALSELFKIELLSKTYPNALMTYIDQFIVKLTYYS